MERHMVSLAEPLISFETPVKDLSDLELGGKAWNLFRLLGFGFSVPPWCVLTTRAFSAAISGTRNAIAEIINSADFTDRASLELASLQIRNIILDSGLNRTQELTAALKQTLGEDALFAVRSSVVGEDSETNSFAGQMDSFLNVPLHQVPSAIKKVWASAFSFRALAYRKRKGLSPVEVSTAVIIQKMVQATAAGVLFTRDHGASTKECVITAALGLGEGVVADLVESDTYRIAWDSDDIIKAVSLKDCRVLLDATRRSGTRKEPVPAELRSQPALDDNQIRLLRDIGVKAEQYFGTAQDIEWAFDRFGQLHVLQTRPIVAGKQQVAPPIRIWDNSNIVESYPGLTPPLTFSFARAAYEDTFRNAAQSFLLFKKELRKTPHLFQNMVGLLDGRVYYNLLNWYEMLSYLPGSKLRRNAWDQMIGISEQIEFPQNKLSPCNRIYSSLVTIWKLLTISRTAKKFFACFNPLYDRFRSIDLTTATEDELIAIYESLTQGVSDYWHLTLENDLSAMTYYEWLKKLCSLWRLSGYPNLHNDLLSGETGVESVAPARSLERLVELFQKEVFSRTDVADDDLVIWRKLQSLPKTAPLREGLENHLKHFGDRGLEELKLETPSFREKPQLLIRLIKERARASLSADSTHSNDRQALIAAEKFVCQHLQNPVKRSLFYFVLSQARCAIVNRENMRFARSRLFGLLRALFRRMGEIFARKGLLESGDDIHYLTVDEVISFVQGTAVAQNLKAIVEIRKQEYAGFALKTPQDRICTVGVPYLRSFDTAENATDTDSRLAGIGCCSGTAEGTAKVIFEARSALASGEHILVTRSTDPGWVFLMIQSKGIVVEKGSVLSHTAIIGRELGIPTIVGVKNATRRIPDGAALSIDGSTGEIRWQ